MPDHVQVPDHRTCLHNVLHSAGSDYDAETYTLSQLAQQSSRAYVLVLDVWRAEQVTSVLELDVNGFVSHSTAFPLYPPGAPLSWLY